MTPEHPHFSAASMEKQYLALLFMHYTVIACKYMCIVMLYMKINIACVVIFFTIVSSVYSSLLLFILFYICIRKTSEIEKYLWCI